MRKIDKQCYSRFLLHHLRQVPLLILMFLTLSVLGQTGVAPMDLPPTGFGIDGDGQANSPIDGVADWWNTIPGSTATNYLLIATGPDDVILNSLYDDHALHYKDVWGGEDPTIFTGSTKVNDPYDATFTYGPGQVPNKNEINRATVHFAFDEDVPHTGLHGDLWCVFSADRQVNNGEAYIDFEFLQAKVYAVPNADPLTGGYFASEGTDGTRTEGDILVTIMFTNGGTVPTPVIQRWENPGSGWTYVTKPLSFYENYVLLTSNPIEITPPWQPYGMPSYLPNQFAEGAINLSALMGFSSNSCGYISTVFVRTKTSQSATAELKDFPGAPYQVSIGTNPIVVSCPDPVTVPACSTDEAIQAAYTTWRNGFTYMGGVPPITENIGDLPVNIDLETYRCGGTIEFTYSVDDDCGPPQTCSSSFTVGDDTPMTINCGTPVDLPACSSLTEIQTAYTAWVARL